MCDNNPISMLQVIRDGIQVYINNFGKPPKAIPMENEYYQLLARELRDVYGIPDEYDQTTPLRVDGIIIINLDAVLKH